MNSPLVSDRDAGQPDRLKMGIGFLIQDSAVYGIANALVKAIGFITLPLLTNHLSVAEFGRVDYFLVMQGFLTVSMVLGFDSAMARFFYDSADINFRRQVIVQSLLVQLFISFLTISAVLLSSINNIFNWSFYNENKSLFLIVLLQSPIMILINCAMGILKWTFRRTAFLMMTLGFAIAQALVWYVALSSFDVGPVGILSMSFATSLLFAIVGVISIRQWFAWPNGLTLARNMLPFAWPMGVVCILGALSPTAERMVTLGLIGEDALGRYAAAAKIGSVMMLLVNAFQTAWGPFSLSIFERSDSPEVFDRVLRGFSSIALAAAFGLAATSPFLLDWLAGSRYASAAALVLPLALALAVQSIGWILEVGISFVKRTTLSLIACIVHAVVTLFAIFILGQLFGLIGVAWGVFLGQLVRTMLAAGLAQYAYPLNWRYFSVLTLLLLALAAAVFVHWCQQEFGDPGYSVAAAIGCLCLIFWAFLFMFSRQERELAKDWIDARRNRRLRLG